MGRLIVAVLLLGIGSAVWSQARTWSALTVRSGSMEPNIPTGSLVACEPVPRGEVEVGDVIVIQRAATAPIAPVLHRVVELRRQGAKVVATTRGDANRHEDPWGYALPVETLRLAFVVPRAGHLIDLAMTPVGWVFFVMLPASLLWALQIQSIWRTDGDDRPRPAGDGTP